MCLRGFTWLNFTELANILLVFIKEPLFLTKQLRDSKPGCCSLLLTWTILPSVDLNGLKRRPSALLIIKRQSRTVLNRLMYSFTECTSLLGLLSIFSLIYFVIRSLKLASEVSFLRFVILHSISQISCTLTRWAIHFWVKINCNSEYLVVSKDKLEVNLMDNVFIVSASSHFMGL